MKKALAIIGIIFGLFVWTVMSWFVGICSHEYYLQERYGENYEYKLQAFEYAEEFYGNVFDGIGNILGEMYGNN